MMLPALMTLPAMPHVRRHGPYGRTYDKYKDWLRDEFQFRCVYCMHREKWDRDGWRAFQLEHIVPQSKDAAKIHVYENIVYCCASCNRTKRDSLLPDPCSAAYFGHYQFETDGTVTPLTDYGAIFVEILGLDAPHLRAFRRKAFRTYAELGELIDILAEDLGLLDENDVFKEIEELLGYPADIPDLRKKRLKTNTKPEGKEQCYFARLERGEIPAIF